MQGHLNFAQGFFTSKSLGFVLGQFNSFSKVQGSGAAKKLAKLCEVTEHTLTALPPREFSACAMQRPSYSSRTVPGRRSVPQPAFSYTTRIPGS